MVQSSTSPWIWGGGAFSGRRGLVCWGRPRYARPASSSPASARPPSPPYVAIAFQGIASRVFRRRVLENKLWGFMLSPLTRLTIACVLTITALTHRFAVPPLPQRGEGRFEFIALSPSWERVARSAG